ncbi:neuronal acetylcholine receptor subunit alpha-10-like [Amphiura filiformis]|uniref:neuronal acetylcholine receptor subunit alpha-10-like n=1 Tax=Amphiura filiformis TaxID=82378 RepID=UPI003B20C5B5
MIRLEEHLFGHYRGLVRPIKDGISPTIVTYRMVLYALLDFDTRNQKFKIMTWIKMTWTDEFLTWNATEFGGIDVVHVPAEKIWLPDISLYQTVDDAFERYKLDTYVMVYSNGSAYWFVPAIYGSSCRMQIRYFPFDTQKCDMRLSSWSYDGNHIDLRAEDVAQNSFLQNGVWTLESVTNRREVTKYQCCPEPYYDLIYTIIFRRNSSFYITYLILPCVFLAALSLLVFYLPPDCGEKLTLSITNLLALVVFQQLVAETMPPSGEESPILGTFFLLMITMVCVSVFFTVIVIHVGYNRTPMPTWVEYCIISCLGKCVCITGSPSSKANKIDLPDISPTEIVGTLQNESETNVYHTQIGRDHIPASNINGRFITDSPNVMTAVSSDLAQIKEILCASRDDMNSKANEDIMLEKWQLVSMIADRVLMIMFTCFTVIVTVVMTTYIVVKSEQEHEMLTDD